MSKKVLPNIVLVLAAIAVIVGVHLLITATWNDIMPRVFGLPEIDGYDLLGMMIIAGWIFPKPTINTKK